MKRNDAEFRLACFVADMLRWGCRPDIVWTHFPAGEARPKKAVTLKNGVVKWFSPAGERLKRMGTLPGVGDYLFFRPGGFVDFLELKVDNNPLSDDQKSFQARVLALGCRYAVARSGQEAVEILRSWGILERIRAIA